MYSRVVNERTEFFLAGTRVQIESVSPPSQTHYLTLVLQHGGCREDNAVLGTFRESKNGYPYIYHLLGATPGPPPKGLLKACDSITEADGATSGDGGGGSSKASAPESKEDDAAGEGEEDPQQAKSGRAPNKVKKCTSSLSPGGTRT